MELPLSKMRTCREHPDRVRSASPDSWSTEDGHLILIHDDIVGRGIVPPGTITISRSRYLGGEAAPKTPGSRRTGARPRAFYAHTFISVALNVRDDAGTAVSPVPHSRPRGLAASPRAPAASRGLEVDTGN
jgi:hypothetical protein